jgi:hypothetical protein
MLEEHDRPLYRFEYTNKRDFEERKNSQLLIILNLSYPNLGLDPDSAKYLFPGGSSEYRSGTLTDTFFARRILWRPLYRRKIKEI